MIILPAEILTEAGWKDIKDLNIINNKICIFNPQKNFLYYEKPLGIYIQPVYFRCFELHNAQSCFYLDESHNRNFVNITPRINDAQRGSVESYSSYDFCNNATYEQALTAVKKIFKIDSSEYNPEMKGEFKAATMEVASMAQWLCVHTGVKCNIRCDLTGITCSLSHEDVIATMYGKVKNYGVNITTTTGHYVVRVCSQSSLCECVYSTFIV